MARDVRAGEGEGVVGLGAPFEFVFTAPLSSAPVNPFTKKEEPGRGHRGWGTRMSTGDAWALRIGAVPRALLDVPLALGAAAPAVPVVDVQGPAPVFATLVLPSGVLKRLSSTFLITAVTAALAPDVEVVPLEGAAYDACAEAASPRILCIVRAALPEQERGRGGRFLAIVSVRLTEIAGREEEVAALLVLDLDRARTILERSADADPSLVDREIRKEAVVVRAPATLLGTAAEGKAFIATQLEPLAERIRAEDPLGGAAQLHVTTTTSGVDLFVDDRRVTTIGEARAVELRRVPAGTHRIAARGPHIEPYVTEIALADGRRRELALELELTNPPIYGPMYSTMKWGGIALAAAGVGVMVYGSVRATHTIVGCIDDTNRLSLPVGLGLLGSGISWSLGAFLFEDVRRLPWIELLVGAAVGGVAAALPLTVPYEAGIGCPLP